MSKIKMIEEAYIKKDIPQFKVGDTVRVLTKIMEADKMRLHPFEGVVIAKSNRGLRSAFTVRKVSFGEGIERVFLLHSPNIEKIEVIRTGKVKRAKLYYLRAKVGKRATKIEQE
ncbi:MAG: 50S ribosomal protein L19 [Candidatus Omnitrophica bacterium]|nr:50S ribosomal protein L19 [Candidatus Omnitrophota bacterium]